MSACRTTSPSCLPRAYPIGRPAVCCGVYSAVRSSVRRVVLQIPRARHAGLVASIVSRMSRECREETGCVEQRRRVVLTVCRDVVSLPPYSQITSSSERHRSSSDGGGGSSSCGTQYGYIITDKAWCPRRSNGRRRSSVRRSNCSYDTIQC